MPKSRYSHKAGVGPRIDVDMDQQQQVVVSAQAEESEEIAGVGTETIEWLDRRNFFIYMQTRQQNDRNLITRPIKWSELFGELEGKSNFYKTIPLKVSVAAVEKIIKHAPQFEQGLDHNHLPAGFRWVTPDDDNRYLHYDARFKIKQKKDDPVAVVLRDTPVGSVPYKKTIEEVKPENKGFFARVFSAPVEKAVPNETEKLDALIVKHEISSQNCIEAMRNMPAAEKSWWVTLLEQHLNYVPFDNIEKLFETFQSFLEKLKELNVTLPRKCEIQDVQNLPVTLGRIHTLLENAKASERQSQLDCVHGLDLSSTGAVLALRCFAYHNEHLAYITPEMRFTEDRWNAEYGYIRDENLTLATLNTKEYKNKWVEILLQNFWRGVARQKNQLGISFYQEAITQIIKEGYSVAITSELGFVLLQCTTNMAAWACEQYSETVMKQAVKDLISLPSITVFPPSASIPALRKLWEREALSNGHAFQIRFIDTSSGDQLLNPMPLPLSMDVGFSIKKAVGPLSLAAFAGSMATDDKATQEKVINYLLDGAMALIDAYDMSPNGFMRGMEFYSLQGTGATTSRTKEILTYKKVISALKVAHVKGWNKYGPLLLRDHCRDSFVLVMSNVSAFSLSVETATRAFEVARNLRWDFCNELNGILSVLASNNNLTPEIFMKLLDLQFDPSSRESFVEAVYALVGANFGGLSVGALKEKLLSRKVHRQHLEKLATLLSQKVSDSTAQAQILSLFQNCVHTWQPLTEYSLVIHKLVRVRDDFMMTNQDFIQFLALLSEYVGHGVDSLNKLLDQVIAERHLSLFQFMTYALRGRELPTQSTLDKITVFYSLKHLMDENNRLLSQQLLWPVLAEAFSKEDITTARAKELVSQIYALVEPLDASTSHMKPLILTFLQKLIAVSSDLSTDIALLKTLMMRYANDLSLVEALLFHYQDQPAVLIDILRSTSQDSDKNSALMRVVTKLAAAHGTRPTSMDVRAVVDSSVITGDVLNTIYIAPPYMSLSSIINKEDIEDIRGAHQDFTSEPYPRTENNVFDSAKAQSVIRTVNKTSLNISADALRDTLHDRRQKTSEEILSNLSAIKSHSTLTPERAYMLVAGTLEMLYRSSGIELNTTQVMAVMLGLLGAPHMALQIESGEGKSRVMMTMAACQQLLGKTVDFVTSNMQLAMRDCLEYDPFFRALDIKTKLIYSSTGVNEYNDGTLHFSTAAQLSLFRNKIRATGNLDHPALNIPHAQRSCLLDEGDATFYDSIERYNFSKNIDSEEDTTWIYPLLVEYIKESDDNAESQDEVTRFRQFVNSKHPSRSDVIAHISPMRIKHWVEAACVAEALIADRHFVVEKNAILFTPEGMIMADKALVRHNNRVAPQSTYSHGVHQCLHARLNYERKKALAPGEVSFDLPFHIEPERHILYSSSAEQLLHHYDDGKIFTVTGTLGSALERQEAKSKYDFDFVNIPRHNKLKRKDLPVYLLRDQAQQFERILKYIRANTDRPILIVCEDDDASAELNEYLSRHMQNNNLQRLHSLNSAEEEAQMINSAKRDGMVTVSTDMVGRGTDIHVPSDHAKGLMVLETYLPTERDLSQAINRAGRFGAEGESRLILNKQTLKERVHTDSLKSGAVNFYHEPERYIQLRQTEIEKRNQTTRLIGEYEMRVKKCVTDMFYVHYQRLAEGNKDGALKTWADFQYDMDILWSQSQNTLNETLDLLRPDTVAINHTFDEYKAQVKQLWNQRFINLEYTDMEPSSVSVSNEMISVPSKAVVHHQWDEALAGRAKTFCHMFEESRALLKGERSVFANSRAWWNGHGVLFADTRATLSGKRNVFANTRASMNNKP